MIAIADINTIWRRKPFAALAEITPVLGLAPMDIFVSWRQRKKADFLSTSTSENFHQCPVIMLPAWASRFPSYSAHRLWVMANSSVTKIGNRLTGLVVTSPHYLALVQKVKAQVPVFYYCSDDYTCYSGWGGVKMLEQEASLTSAVHHSFFVSRSLANRAITKYGIPSERVSISPNATERNFLNKVSEQNINNLLQRYPKLHRPLIGVVGGINERLDIELLLAVAKLPEVGTLVMVGPVASNLRGSTWNDLFCHQKCQFVGTQPHNELPTWMQALDVALIPYRDTPLNRNCSPMRLFDHLASGRPIVSTDSCAQVLEYSSSVKIACNHNTFLEMLSLSIAQKRCKDEEITRREVAAGNLWQNRAEHISLHLKKYIS